VSKNSAAFKEAETSDSDLVAAPVAVLAILVVGTTISQAVGGMLMLLARH